MNVKNGKSDLSSKKTKRNHKLLLLEDLLECSRISLFVTAPSFLGFNNEHWCSVRVKYIRGWDLRFLVTIHICNGVLRARWRMNRHLLSKILAPIRYGSEDTVLIDGDNDAQQSLCSRRFRVAMYRCCAEVHWIMHSFL